MKMLPFLLHTYGEEIVTSYGQIILSEDDGAIFINGFRVKGTIEEWLPKIQAHNDACLGVEPVEEEKDPYEGWAVKPGMWVRLKCYDPFQAVEHYAAKDRLMITTNGGAWGETEIRVAVKSGRLTILTPEEVEEHLIEIKYKDYPVKPGEWVEMDGEIFEVKPHQSDNWVNVGALGYSKSEVNRHLDRKVWRLVPDHEVEEHLLQEKYPVARDGDYVEATKAINGNLYRLKESERLPGLLTSNEWAGSYSQDEIKAKLDSGEWKLFINGRRDK
jgi:hypothetical protein